MKLSFGRDSALDPAGGDYSAPPDPLAGFKGRRGEREERGREGKGGKRSEKDKRGREGEELEGEGSWNRAADWLRSALPGGSTKGAITSKIKHAKKLKTSPARLARLLHNCCNHH